MTERITNWDGTGRDQILSYRRTSNPPAIYNGDGEATTIFHHPGSYIDFVMHADLCGDNREEVIGFNESTAWIFANGECDLEEPAREPAVPQIRRLYNWTIYSGWDAVDHSFYTPGSIKILKEKGLNFNFLDRPGG